MGNLVKVSPEHVREVSALEQLHIPQRINAIPGIEEEGEVRNRRQTETTPTDIPEVQQNPIEVELETRNPEPIEDIASRSSGNVPNNPQSIAPAEIPIPDDTDDELLCDHLLCVEDETCHENPNAGWKWETIISENEINSWKAEHPNEDFLLVASNAKRDRSEVKLHQLSKSEQALFDSAQAKEIQNWLDTGTVSKIFRNQLNQEQILRCRWICIWKPLENEQSTHSDIPCRPGPKAKARLVVLGFEDPQIDSIPRDSPTLGKQSNSSMGWTLKSFDIRAAFLQGKTQENRVLAIEPVEELRRAMNLKPGEVCKLEKSAYDLIDAPYLWHRELDRTLRDLNFVPAPFDPCAYILYQSGKTMPSGALGVHVDDGLCGGDEDFDQQISKLEAKFPFGSKKTGQFTFTGVDISQQPDQSIIMSQSKYVSKIEPIHMNANRNMPDGTCHFRRETQSPSTNW